MGAARKLCHPVTSVTDYTADELEYLAAIDAYCTQARRRFLTACEHLALVRSLGYRRVAAPGPLPEFHRGR